MGTNRADDHGQTLLKQRFTASDLSRLRAAVYAWAQRTGLDRKRAKEFMFAVNEGLTNAIAYAGGSGELTLMREDRKRLVAEITDHGPGLTDAVPPRLPRPEATGGRGLWLAKWICDEMRVRSGPGGTTLRLAMHVPGAAHAD